VKERKEGGEGKKRDGGRGKVKKERRKRRQLLP